MLSEKQYCYCSKITSTQQAFTLSKLTKETLEQGVKYRPATLLKRDSNTGVVLVPILLTLKYSTPCSHVSFVNLEQVNAGCETS